MHFIMQSRNFDFFDKLTKILHLIEGPLSILVYLSYGHKLCDDFKSTHSMCHIEQITETKIP
jgi:hypothetical protein